MVCSVIECQSPSYRRGFCKKHYARYYRHGDPLGGSTGAGEVERFIQDVVLPYEGDDCLTWPFARGGKGYAYMRKTAKSMQPASIPICETVHGPAPSPEHEAAHSCGNGHLACVNPRHLSWKTPVENNADKYIHDTHNRGERNGSAKITEDDALVIYSLKGAASQAEIAARFGVSRSMVGLIHTAKKWAWLTQGGAA
jgi:hypothetical protein